ncbi:MAG: hypothetical protein IPM50_09665 [Acidobacteriota bacterium]|nr:MAG: hypothetical protein IPM50_09665 [Acidobacteriota bacterium]
MRKMIFAAFVMLLASAAATQVAAQKVYTPERGSAERKAILDALRVPVERDLKQKIVFNTEYFNVSANWAFLGGDPQTPEGGKPNYRGTRYWEAVRADMFDNNFFTVLRKTGGRWRVVTYAIGCTDVCYADWWRRHRAPKAIFPYTE